MNTEKFIFEGPGLPAIIHMPEGKPRAILQIIHGMTEHIGRYGKLAEELTANGIAVAGYDLRGHGENKCDPHVASFGEGGWEKSVEDIHMFNAALKKRFGEIPVFMLGFSLGSFLLREYLSVASEDTAGAIIMGTGDQPAFVMSIMCAIVNSQVKKAGFDSTTPLVQKLSFETYNQKFKPNRTASDWLCADEKQLDAYINDPLCREHISAGLFLQLLSAMKRTGNAESCRNWRKDLPVLIISGKDDPVGNSGKGVIHFENNLRKAGMKNIHIKLFPGARHDILHEEASGTAAEAREMIAAWLEENMY